MARDSFGLQLKNLAELAKGGDVPSLARLLSLVEGDLRKSLSFLASLKQSSALKIGITGPPGAGKSSLVNLLISEYRKSDLKVGVLAVDPSSPWSGGAFLGDRVRMNEHAADSGVYIRSLGARGGFGGLSSATGAMIRVLEICGFDIILVETVGVGQTELQIMNLADCTAVVLVPESGDVVQTLKAGILEIADLFVVNKSDRPGADTLAAELKELSRGEVTSKTLAREILQKEVLMTSALPGHGQSDGAMEARGQGITVLALMLLDLSRQLKKNKKRNELKKKGELRALILGEFDKQVQKKVNALSIIDPYKSLMKIKSPRI